MMLDHPYIVNQQVPILSGYTRATIIAISSVLSMLLVLSTVGLSSLLLLLIKGKQNNICAIQSRPATSQTLVTHSTPMAIHTQENVAYERTGLTVHAEI